MSGRGCGKLPANCCENPPAARGGEPAPYPAVGLSISGPGRAANCCGISGRGWGMLPANCRENPLAASGGDPAPYPADGLNVSGPGWAANCLAAGKPPPIGVSGRPAISVVAGRADGRRTACIGPMSALPPGCIPAVAVPGPIEARIGGRLPVAPGVGCGPACADAPNRLLKSLLGRLSGRSGERGLPGDDRPAPRLG